MSDHPGDDLIARCHANYIEMFRALARVCPDGAIEEDGDAVMVRSGPLLPLNNFVALRRPLAGPDALLARARAFYAPAAVRFAVCGWEESVAAWEVATVGAGMTGWQTPGMLVAPLQGERPPVPGLTIERVGDRAELRVYNDTMTAGFGGEWARPAIIERDALLNVPELSHYTGYLDGVPVATAMRFSSHGIAGLFNISTLPAYRRRGIGAAMTMRAALDGLSEGCTASYLQASDAGRPLYERLGYRTITTYHMWLSPALASP